MGIDSFPVRRIEDRTTLFNEHIRGLKSNPWTKNAYLVLMAERSTGMESGALKNILFRYPKTAAYNQPEKSNPLNGLRKDMLNENLIEYYQKTQKNPGFTPSAELKMDGLDAFRGRLVENSLFYYEHCICKNPFLVQYNEMEKFIHTKLELEEQAKRVKEYPTSKLRIDNKKPVITWSAKTNEHGETQAGYNDDLMVMIAFASHLWQEAMKYNGCLPGFPYDEINFDDNLNYDENFS